MKHFTVLLTQDHQIHSIILSSGNLDLDIEGKPYIHYVFVLIDTNYFVLVNFFECNKVHIPQTLCFNLLNL